MTANPKIRKQYDELGGLDAYRRQVLEELPQQSGFDPNRDIDGTIERLKHQYVIISGRPGDCMSQMIERTLGYHPKSNICRMCPVQQECLERLQSFTDFDIFALRSGKMTSEQAMAEVRKKRGG